MIVAVRAIAEIVVVDISNRQSLESPAHWQWSHDWPMPSLLMAEDADLSVITSKPI